MEFIRSIIGDNVARLERELSGIRNEMLLDGELLRLSERDFDAEYRRRMEARAEELRLEFENDGIVGTLLPAGMLIGGGAVLSAFLIKNLYDKEKMRN